MILTPPPFNKYKKRGELPGGGKGRGAKACKGAHAKRASKKIQQPLRGMEPVMRGSGPFRILRDWQYGWAYRL